MNLDTSHSARSAAGAHALHGTRHAGAAASTSADPGAGLSFLSLLGGAQDALGSDMSAAAVSTTAPSAAEGLPWLAGLAMAAQPIATGQNLLKADDGRTMTAELIEATDAQPPLTAATATTAAMTTTDLLAGGATDQTSPGENGAPVSMPDLSTMNLAAVLPAGPTPLPLSAQPLPSAVSATVVRGVQMTTASSPGRPEPRVLAESPVIPSAPAPTTAVPASPAANAGALPVTDAPRADATTLLGAGATSVNVNPAPARSVPLTSASRASNDPVPAEPVTASLPGTTQALAPDASTPELLPVVASPSPAANGAMVIPVRVRAERMDSPVEVTSSAPVMPAVGVTVTAANASPVAPGLQFDIRPSAAQDVTPRWPTPIAASLEPSAAAQPVPAVVIQVPGAQVPAPARTTVQLYGAPSVAAQPASAASAGVPTENSGSATVLATSVAAQAAVPAVRDDWKPSLPNAAQESRVAAQRSERLADANAVFGRSAPEAVSGMPSVMPGVVANAPGLIREPGTKRNESSDGAVAGLDNGWRAAPATPDSNGTGSGTSFAPELAVADQIQGMVSQNVKNADFQLDLGGQGKVDVSISMSGSEARVEFRSDQAQTRDLLGQTLGQLDELLRREGLVLTGASVGTSAGQAGQAFQPPVPTAERQDRMAAPLTADATSAAQAPRRSVVAQGMVDLYA